MDVKDTYAKLKTILTIKSNKLHNRGSNLPKLIFLHIPRTGGTTIGTILKANYSKNEILDFHGITYKNDFYQSYLQNNNKNNSINLVLGHFPFGIHQYLNEDMKYITIIRNPIHRIISHYCYVKNNKNHHLHKFVAAKSLSIAEYVKSGLSTELDNGQVRLLAGSTSDLAVGNCASCHLELAKENLKKHFIEIGVTENIPLFYANLRHKFNFIITENLWVNRTNGKSQHTHSDTIIYDTIIQYNRFDYELYNWIVNESRNILL